MPPVDQSPAPSFGPVVDLLKVPGVVVGDSNAAAANSRILNAALAAPYVAPDGTKSTARIVSLGSTWPSALYCDPPLRLPAGVKLRGIDPLVSKLSSVYSPWAILENLPLDPIDPVTHARKPLTADHWVDAGTIGDGTAKGAFGPRWQFRTKGDAFLACPGSAVSAGLDGASHLTIEAALRLNDPTPTDGILCGTSDGTGRPQWQVRISSGCLWLGFTTADGVLRSCMWSLPPSPGTLRFALDLDLANGKLLCVINGTQTPPRLATLGSGFASRSGSALAAAGYAEFTVGVESMATAQVAGQGVDFSILGLRVGTKAAYRDAGDGKPAVRLDGRPITDSVCYLEGDGCLWLLRGEEFALSNVVDSGFVPVRPANDVAVALQPANASVDATSHDNTIERVSIGGGILLGPIYGFTLRDSVVDSSVDALASAFPVATYPTLITTSKLGANRYPVNLWMQMAATIRDCFITHSGPTTFAFRESGQVKVSDTFVAGFGPVQRCFDFVGSGDNQLITIENVALDFEGVASPSDCLVRCTANSGQSGTRLTVRNVSVGTVPDGVPLVRLLSRAGTTGPVAPAWYDISNVAAAFGSPQLIQASGQWREGGR